MFYRISLAAARRVAPFPTVARSLLTRPISSTPTPPSPAKSSASTTKSSSKTATKTTTKSKAKGTKEAKDTKSKKTKKAKTGFTREQLKVPRRPSATSYMTFAIEERMNMPKATTLEESQEQSRTIAQKWKTLSPEEKKAYEAKAAEQNEILAKTWNEWLTSLDSAVLREINARRRAAGKPRILRPSDSPKKPVSAFLRFLNEYKLENPSLVPLEAAKQAGVAWHALPQEKKQVYLDAYAADRKVFALEQEAHAKAQEFV